MRTLYTTSSRACDMIARLPHRTAIVERTRPACPSYGSGPWVRDRQGSKQALTPTTPESLIALCEAAGEPPGIREPHPP